MCAVRHTVHDPRRETVLRGGEDLFGSAPAACPSRSSPPPLHPIPESSSGPCASRARPGAALARQQPWQSPAVADFARRAGDDNKHLRPMVLQGPRGTALRAVGEASDHEVASRTVADIEARRGQTQPGPRADHAEARLPGGGGRRNAVRRGTDVALAVPGPSQQAASFGAVYEYRDSCGTAKLVASTSKVPERQFALDQRHYEDVLSTSKDPALVWVGISGGRGALNEAEMTEVRREVTNARATRLQVEKLGDIKPYSRHG